MTSEVVLRIEDALVDSPLLAANENEWREAAEMVFAYLAEAGIAIIPPTVTRVHVVGAEVREYWADEWRASIQDDERTLKLFAVGSGAKARQERDKALGYELVEKMRRYYCNKCGGAFVGEHKCGRLG